MTAPNLNAFLGVLLRQVQSAENATYSVITSRFLAFAADSQLDALGRLVGESRLGRTDEAFRAGIQLRIYVNGSSGRPEDLIYIARMLTGRPVVNYFDVSPGVFWLVIPGWTPDSGELLTFLQSLSPAGTRLLYVTPTHAVDYFRVGDLVGMRLIHSV